MNYGCKDLKVVISGGTSGIGLATARLLLRDEAQVVLLGRSQEKGQIALKQLAEEGLADKAAFLSCDIREAESCKAVAAKIKEALKTDALDILVNSAGVYEEQGLEQLEEEAYLRIFDTNVKGTLLLTKTLLPMLQKGGSIVNIASDAGISGNYGCPVYCASKGAVVALTKALALDLAPKIRVNCICPADVDTPLLEAQLEACGGGYTKAEMAECYPLERIGRAEEIAHVICSVASPVNSFMTGSIIPVDGGLTAK